MSRLLATFAILIAGCAMPGKNAVAPDGPEALASAESAFAAHSVREGMRAAFLHWLAPGATLYRNGPVDGLAFIAANPDPPIVLDWRPVYVELPASGEMGLSTGPWTVRSRKDPSAPPRHGQFVSVWKRSGSGPWRVWIDLGISHPGAELAKDTPRAFTTPQPGLDSAESLATAEERFARTAAAAGDAVAYAESASDSVRVYREGHAPYLGRTAALASPAARSAPSAWFVDKLETSASGEFGFSTGSFGPSASTAPAGHFLRVWRRERIGWRIALDIVNDLAPRQV